MRIGLLKEVKVDERRVALLPKHARILVDNGHRVHVEAGAGAQSGFSDADYCRFGAHVMSKADVLHKSELLLKVKAPLLHEYCDYTQDHTLFTYLHFDENITSKDIQSLINSGFLGIAYEWVGEDGCFPLLEPMSRLTGYLFAQKALELCAREKSTFCAANEAFLRAGNAIIIGCGNIGLSVLKYYLDLNLRLIVVHNAPLDLVEDRIEQRFHVSAPQLLKGREVRFIRMEMDDPRRTKDQIAALLPQSDIVINAAVRRQSLPKSKLEYLVDREMVQSMAGGSVICDATACDKDLIETCVSSSSLHETYRESGVVHYNCDHIPALVARTASELLTHCTFPYIFKIAEQGVLDTIRSDAGLRNGVSCYKGALTHRISAQKKGLPFRRIDEFLTRYSGTATGDRSALAAAHTDAVR